MHTQHTRTSIHRQHKKEKKIVAIKIIDLEESKEDIFRIHREIISLTQAKSCKQLITYHKSEVFGTKLWIIMEFLGGGSLYDIVRVFVCCVCFLCLLGSFVAGGCVCLHV